MNNFVLFVRLDGESCFEKSAISKQKAINIAESPLRNSIKAKEPDKKAKRLLMLIVPSDANFDDIYKSKRVKAIINESL